MKENFHAKLNRETVNANLQIDNEDVRVTEYHFVPDAETNFHKHEFDYVVVPLTDGELSLIGEKGEEIRAKLKRGLSYFRKAGIEHNVINVGKKDLIFIELEMKKKFSEIN